MMLAKTFKSKANLFLVSPIYALLVLVILLLLGSQYWTNAVIVAGVGFTFIALLFDTTYRLSNHVLVIKNNILIRKKINVNTITKIKATSDLVALPALTMDQLCIFFNHGECIIISPKEKTDFIKTLRTLNPSIEIDE